MGDINNLSGDGGNGKPGLIGGLAALGVVAVVAVVVGFVIKHLKQKGSCGGASAAAGPTININSQAQQPQEYHQQPPFR